ncbi:hypothetical protein GGF46_002656 [Coemansia sp. RSA 552]|nr:hypothetical protein GGF46_002656 [Coemansia sp. RSA 552]
MPNPLEEWYTQLPLFTRLYTTGIGVLTLALQLEWVSPFQLFYSYHSVFESGEYWRLVTSFLYLGNFSLDWLLNVYFIVRYCRDLEEGSYLNRPADFVWTVFLMCVVLLVLAPYLGAIFLGDLLVASLTYVWSRHYSYLFISFMGLFTTSAVYLPWVLIAFSALVENRWPTVDLVAIGVGHVFWFLADEWPQRPESGGSRPLQAPKFLCRMLHQELPEDVEEEEREEEGPATDEPGPEPERELPSSNHGVDQGSDRPPEYGEAGDAGESIDAGHAGSSAIAAQGDPSSLQPRAPYTYSNN